MVQREREGEIFGIYAEILGITSGVHKPVPCQHHFNCVRRFYDIGKREGERLDFYTENHRGKLDAFTTFCHLQQLVLKYDENVKCSDRNA